MPDEPSKPNNPPAMWLQGPGGVRVLPKYERQEDGSWKMLNPEAVKALVKMGTPPDSGKE